MVTGSVETSDEDMADTASASVTLTDLTVRESESASRAGDCSLAELRSKPEIDGADKWKEGPIWPHAPNQPKNCCLPGLL